MPTIKYISLWSRRPFAPPIPTVRERPRREGTPTLLAEDLSDEPDQHEAPEDPFLDSSSRYSDDAEMLTWPKIKLLWDDVDNTMATAASSVPGPQAGQRSSSGLLSARHSVDEEDRADSVSVYSSDDNLYRYHIVPPDDVSETIEDDVDMKKKRCICRRIYKRVVKEHRRQKTAAKRAGSALKQMVKRPFSKRIQI